MLRFEGTLHPGREALIYWPCCMCSRKQERWRLFFSFVFDLGPQSTERCSPHSGWTISPQWSHTPEVCHVIDCGGLCSFSTPLNLESLGRRATVHAHGDALDCANWEDLSTEGGVIPRLTSITLFSDCDYDVIIYLMLLPFDITPATPQIIDWILEVSSRIKPLFLSYIDQTL